jgi:hypothetical protein
MRDRDSLGQGHPAFRCCAIISAVGAWRKLPASSSALIRRCADLASSLRVGLLGRGTVAGSRLAASVDHLRGVVMQQPARPSLRSRSPGRGTEGDAPWWLAASTECASWTRLAPFLTARGCRPLQSANDTAACDVHRPRCHSSKTRCCKYFCQAILLATRAPVSGG